MSPPATRLAALAVAILLAAAAPAGAAQRALQPPRLGPLPQRPFAAPLKDRIISAGAEARAARAVAHTAAETYTTSDGNQILVEVSQSYSPNRDQIQAFVDFLGSRLHGPELSKLGLLIATPAEIQQLCGPQALACYTPLARVMAVPGEQTPDSQVPLEFVITHELGHHVATFRLNDPWPAPTWGPKYWATYEHICEGVFSGRYFPGDEGSHYGQNPGENFAESYALFHYRDAAWQFDPSLRPDDGAFAAIQRDVLDPWKGPVIVKGHGMFSPSHHGARRFPIPTPLDGRVGIKLTGPSAANFDLQVWVNGRPVARSKSLTSRDTLEGAACGSAATELRVVRRSGYGSFQVSVSRPS